MRRTRWPIIAALSGALSLGACGSGDPSTADAVAGASTCAELVDAYEVGDVTTEEAELIAARLVDLAEADFADDGVFDDLVVCNQVIRELDPEHAAVFEGIDLEELERANGQARNG